MTLKKQKKARKKLQNQLMKRKSQRKTKKPKKATRTRMTSWLKISMILTTIAQRQLSSHELKKLSRRNCQ